ncbi:hypothetical protein H4R34_002309 [Dimargaris verticillata]|uniref:Septin-type G domain-containing protein n=1 Tax=Dimargaris verticillata TaxID=2761393 RepID=A0A9W8EE74_9FUNG|nr:hypothetical protein H4R34_002309 [Dimargaris verticillata]
MTPSTMQAASGLPHRAPPPPLPAVPPPAEMPPLPEGYSRYVKPSSGAAAKAAAGDAMPKSSKLNGTTATPHPGTGLDNPLLRNFKRNKNRVRGRHVIEHFNLMVVGPRGVGKTAFLHTLCNSLTTANTTVLNRHRSLRRSSYVPDGAFSPTSPTRPATAEPSPTFPVADSLPAQTDKGSAQVFLGDEGPTQDVAVHSFTVDDFEQPLLLNLIDTPGWIPDSNGESAAQVCDTIINFIEDQMDKRVVEEFKICRDKYAPNLIVHACLYFMDPLHHAFRATDLEIIKRLGTRVNLIPVVGKSDLVTLTQKLQFQSRFVEVMKANADQVALLDLPTHDSDASGASDSDAGSPTADAATGRDSIIIEPAEGEGGSAQTLMMPFFLFSHEVPDAISLDLMSTDAQKSNLPGVQQTAEALRQVYTENPRFLGRCYAWGQIDCMNPAHCDFAILRAMLLESHRALLRQHTMTAIYEEYRYRQLQSNRIDDLLRRSGSVRVKRLLTPTSQP